MSKRKYHWKKPTQEQLSALAEKFPKAVETITTRKPVYNVIAKLLDCDVAVPGIELVAEGVPDETSVDMGTPAAEVVPAETPAFLAKKKVGLAS